MIQTIAVLSAKINSSMIATTDDNLRMIATNDAQWQSEFSSHPALVHIRVPQAGLAVLLASSQHLHTKHDGHGNDNNGDQLKWKW